MKLRALPLCLGGLALLTLWLVRPGEAAPPPRITSDMSRWLGVNEGIAVPRAWVDRGLVRPEGEPAAAAERAALVRELGARSTRVNTATWPWMSCSEWQKAGQSWERPDALVRAAQDQDIELIFMVGPWPGNQTANYTERYLPDDMPAYARCLASIVERYDGDGRSDMPGLKRPIHHWEVDNEPDLHHTAPPRGKAGGKAAGKAKAQGSKVGAKAEGASKIGGKAGAKAGKVAGAEAPSDFETPEEYARVLIESARAIRGADARAVVLSGGIYRPHRPEGRDYLRDVLAVPGAREAFDVLSLHCYMEGPGLDPLQRCLATAAELAPDKPVWLTEIGLPSSSRQAHQTEDWQARALVELVARALIAGVDRFYWHSLGQPPNAEQALQASAFATHGLAQSLGEGPGAGHRVKPSGEAYRRLQAILAGARPGEVKAQSAAGGELLWLGHGWLAWSGKPAAPEGAGPCQDLLQGGEGDGTAPCWYPAR